ncbi:uncharacterized protein [Nicotiana sylvestris]|uniref:uncharacterized protein n=1 Tax=Nicotiana sylvestris TaxID=4096 RepID=UPI00388CA43A
MGFSKLARHVVWLVPTDRHIIGRLIDGLTFQLWFLMTRDTVSGATFDKVIDIAWQIEMVCIQERFEREAKRSHGSGGFSCASSRAKRSMPLALEDCVAAIEEGEALCQVLQGFSSIASPLTKLTQEVAPFRWSDECEQSFQKLKTALTTALVLVLPSTSGSSTLKLHKKNGIVHDLELAAIAHVLKIWRHYLYGVSYDIFTGHRSLQHLFKQKDLNLRQQRWLELLKDYDITIMYHSRKANVVVDALSRKAESMGSLAFIPVSIISDRGTQFTSQFWRAMQQELDTQGHFLLLVEFAYNKGYQSSIQVALYKALYGRRCRSLVDWFEPGEAKLLGTNLVENALDKIKLIQERLHTARSRQKSYADRKVLDVSYMVGEKVLLKISP